MNSHVREVMYYHEFERDWVIRHEIGSIEDSDDDRLTVYQLLGSIPKGMLYTEYIDSIRKGAEDILMRELPKHGRCLSYGETLKFPTQYLQPFTAQAGAGE